MILKKLSLYNFRQFKGQHEIIFAAPDSHSKNNVTVIYGENGRGKTGIFRAIIFSLYGERHLTQDGDVGKGEIKLINLQAIQEADESGKQTADAWVQLEFDHRGSVYNIRRCLLGMRDGGKVHEEISNLELSIIGPDGNCRMLSDPADILSSINAILDNRVKEYFLFDGEKIERLTKASSDQRREIAKGIRNLLNVDSLGVAQDAVKKLCKALSEELRRHTTGEVAQVLKLIEEVKDRQEIVSGRLESLLDELSKAQEESIRSNQELKKFEEIREIVEHIEELKKKDEQQDEKLKSSLIEMKNYTAKAAMLLLSSTIQNAYDSVDMRKKKGEIPSQIRMDLIDKILTEGICICQREVCPGSESYQAIREWRDRTANREWQDSELELWRFLSTVISREEDLREQIELKLMNFVLTRDGLEKIRTEQKSFQDQIAGSAREDQSKLAAICKALDDKIVTLKAEELNRKNELQQLDSESERLELQRRELMKKEGLRSELEQRYEIATGCADALKSVYEHFTVEIKDTIGRLATEHLHSLLDEEGCKSLRRIVVNEDYSLQLLDRWNKPFLANISAGQRQIMSISFIAALAQTAASENDRLEMPLFMDTPFGRLSYQHRKNLVEHVPEFCAQWILLATDTEFRRSEARLLKHGGLWSHFYMLRPNDDGSSRIEYRDPQDALLSLKEDEDERP